MSIVYIFMVLQHFNSLQPISSEFLETILSCLLETHFSCWAAAFSSTNVLYSLLLIYLTLNAGPAHISFVFGLECLYHLFISCLYLIRLGHLMGMCWQQSNLGKWMAFSDPTPKQRSAWGARRTTRLRIISTHLSYTSVSLFLASSITCLSHLILPALSYLSHKMKRLDKNSRWSNNDAVYIIILLLLQLCSDD